MLEKLKRLFAPKAPEQPGTIPKKFISNFLPPKSVIVEAGAHIGVDTVEMATLWPDSMVHAFEPIPSLHSQLESNTRALPNVIRHRFALGNTTGRQLIHVSKGISDASSSLLVPKEHLRVHPGVEFDETMEVDTVTLDDWASKTGIDHVDFMWLDLQGFELQALQSAMVILRTVTAIHCEVSLIKTYEGCALYPELRVWLAERGFRVEREETPWVDMGNVLFVRNRN